jgi:ribonuclease H / adenosylcobalamin/alpha-ribazole phosphatase
MSPGSDSVGADPGSDGSAGDDSARAATGWRAPHSRPTTTLLLRHGQTALSVERRFAGRGDIPLTEIGLQQAAAAAAAIAERGRIDMILSSPLQRAWQSALAVAERTGAPLAADDDLAETDFGSWEGMTFAEVMARWPDDMAAWMAAADAAPPGGESFASVAERVDAALDRLLMAHQGKTVVVVSHVTPIKTIVCRALLAPSAAMFRIHLDVASVCEAAWFADGPALVRSLNDTAHLRRS